MEKKKVSKKKTAPEPYVFAIGRRKTALARVKLYMAGTGELKINQRELLDYFPTLSLQKLATAALSLTGLAKKVNVMAAARGGGLTAQAEAVGLAISRALVESNKDLRTVLKKEGLLTRDARKKERKKPGLKRARRAPQWQKR